MNRPHDEVSIVEILFDIISLILPIRAALALTSMHLSNLVACCLLLVLDRRHMIAVLVPSFLSFFCERIELFEEDTVI